MKDNKYCRIVSETALSEDKKAEIKTALESTCKKDNEIKVVAVSPSAVRKRRIKIISAIAAVLVLVIGASWLLSAFINVYSVNSPISLEEYQYMADVAENAQYLPNENILASDSVARSLSVSASETVSQYENFYDEAISVESEDLSFSLENYQNLNDSLATISSTETNREMTIYDIKAEIRMALEVVPGYDQWFMLYRQLPYLNEEDSTKYAYNSYKVNYDKVSGKIVVERLRNKTRGDSYDKSSGTYYTQDSYQRQYFKVEYYFDENEREVVDCTVINYLCVDGKNYYPVSAQRLINVKDFSLTKYAATYMRKPEVVNPSMFGNNDTVFDLTDMYDYGLNTIIIQLNYNSSDDISFIKAYYEAPDAHYGRETLGEVSYYRKTPDYSAYFTAGWDNRPSDWDSAIKAYNDVSTATGSDVRREIIKTFEYVRDIRYDMMCDECEEEKPSADGIFIDCKHGILLDRVNRAQTQIFTDSVSVMNDPDAVFDGITDQFAIAASELGITTAFTLGEGEYFFETSANEFFVESGKEYRAKQVLTADYENIDKTVNKSAVMLNEDIVSEALKNKYDFTYDVDDDSVMKGTDVAYDLEMKVNICDPDPDAEYYLAVILQSEKTNAPFTVLDRVLVDTASNEKIGINGHVDIDTLVEEALKQCTGHDSSLHFRLAYAVVKYSSSGSPQLISPSRTIDVDYSESANMINKRMYYVQGSVSHSYCVSPYNGGISIRLGF